MTGIFVVNVLILIFAIVFWQYYHFSQDLFWLGLIGSIINTCGLTFMNTAISIGPLGPVASIGACANILLVIIEAVRHMKVPTYVEFIALVVGFGGALELVVPEFFEKVFCCCCKSNGTKTTNEKAASHKDEKKLAPEEEDLI